MWNCLVVMTLVSLLFGCADQWYTRYGINDKSLLTSTQTLPQLILALSDDDLRVRRVALVYIKRMGVPAKEAIPNVKNSIKVDDANRLYAIRALAAIGQNSEEILDFLKVEEEMEQDGLAKKTYNDAINQVSLSILTRSFVFYVHLPGELPGKTLKFSFLADYHYFNGYRKIDMIKNDGILPLLVEINNNTNIPITINPDSIKLFNIDKKEMTKPDQSFVLECQQVDYVKASLIFAPAGVPRAIRANVAINKYFDESLLKNVTMQPNSSTLRDICIFMFLQKQNT